MNESSQLKCNINLKRDISSFYNIEMIFSYLENKQKLNMIIYNKHLQKILELISKVMKK